MKETNEQKAPVGQTGHGGQAKVSVERAVGRTTNGRFRPMEDYRNGKRRCNVSEASRQEGSAKSEPKRDNDGHCAQRMPKIEQIPPRKAQDFQPGR